MILGVAFVARPELLVWTLAESRSDLTGGMRLMYAVTGIPVTAVGAMALTATRPQHAP